MKPSVEAARITDDPSAAVAGFFRKVWTDNATDERVRRARAEAARLKPAIPGANVPAVAYLRDGEIIGHRGTIPVKFRNGQVETAGHWLSRASWCRPSIKTPAGFGVLREMLKHVDVSGTMTVALPARRLFQALGFADCGVMLNYISLLRAALVATSIDIANIGQPSGVPTYACRRPRTIRTDAA